MEIYKILRYITYFVEILICFVLQQLPIVLPGFSSAKPVFLLSIVIALALFEGEKAGICFGLLCGIFMDVGFSGFLGFYSITLTLIGFIIGLLSRNTLRNNFSTSIIVAFFVSLLFFGIEFLFFYISKGYAQPLWAIKYYYLPKFLYTFLVCTLFYFINRALALNIRKKENIL